MLYDVPSMGLSFNNSTIAKDFYVKYKLKDKSNEPKPFLINSFSKIGWLDPFSFEAHASTKCCKSTKKL